MVSKIDQFVLPKTVRAFLFRGGGSRLVSFIEIKKKQCVIVELISIASFSFISIVVTQCVTSVERRTIRVRILGKVLQVSKMLVPDGKYAFQVPMFLPFGHNVTTY